MRKWLRKLMNRARFGRVTSEVKAYVQHVPAEIAYYDRHGAMVGYWAYGYFDPSFPYKE